MPTDQTGWEPEHRAHFDEIVENYDRVRPNYPDALFVDALAYAGASGGGRALEIGAGTGKATRPFLDAGYGVTAVEIGENMAQFLRERYKGYKDFRVIVSAFEDAVLEDDSYDLIYAASAFHWVNAEIGCPKVFRLLKHGGAVALLRYNFNIVPAGCEEADEEIRALFEENYFGYYTSKAEKPRSAAITKEKLRESPRILSGYGFKDLADYGFAGVTMNLYDATRTYTADEWIAFLGTMSDCRQLPEINRDALYAGIREAIQRHGGQYKVDFVFQLYMGRKL